MSDVRPAKWVAMEILVEVDDDGDDDEDLN